MRRGGALRLIAEREIRERVSGRVTRIVTVVTVILVIAGIAIPGLIKSSATSTKIGLIGSRSQALAPALERAAKAATVTVRLSDIAGVAPARALLDAGKLDAAINAGTSSATIVVEQSLSAGTRAMIAAAVDEAHFRTTLAKAGVPLAKVLPAVTPVALSTVVLKPQPEIRTRATWRRSSSAC